MDDSWPQSDGLGAPDNLTTPARSRSPSRLSAAPPDRTTAARPPFSSQPPVDLAPGSFGQPRHGSIESYADPQHRFSEVGKGKARAKSYSSIQEDELVFDMGGAPMESEGPTPHVPAEVVPFSD